MVCLHLGRHGVGGVDGVVDDGGRGPDAVDDDDEDGRVPVASFSRAGLAKHKQPKMERNNEHAELPSALQLRCARNRRPHPPQTTQWSSCSTCCDLQTRTCVQSAMCLVDAHLALGHQTFQSNGLQFAPQALLIVEPSTFKSS